MGKGSIILLTARPKHVVTVDVLETDPVNIEKWMKGHLQARNARGRSRLGQTILSHALSASNPCSQQRPS